MDRTPPRSWWTARAHPRVARLRRWIEVIVALGVCSAGGVACKYDSADRCGTGQVMRNGLCACADGMTLKGRTCVAAVMAAAGSSAPPPDGGTAAAGLGKQCTMDAECVDAPYTACIKKNASSGYCSRTGCTTSCEAGYFCATDASPAYCKRLPTGEGATCTTDANCLNQDASYCALDPSTGQSSCVVRDCSAGGCSPTFSNCLDLSMFMPGGPKICVPPS